MRWQAPRAPSPSAVLGATQARSPRSVSAVATFAGGNLAITAIGFIAAVVQSRFVPPAELGTFKQFGILSTYLVFLNAGTFDVMAREYPYLLGSGRRDEADSFAASCQGWIVLVTGVTVGMFAALALVAGIRGDPYAAGGWGTQIVVMSGSLYGGYLATTYRTTRHFASLTLANAAGAIAGLLGLAVVAWWPYAGMCLRTAAASAVPLWLLHRSRPLVVGLRWDVATIRRAIRSGIPLSAIGYLDNGFARAAEATVALAYLGAHGLGTFALAQTAYMALLVVPLAVGTFFLPRLAHEYGASRQLAGIIRSSIRPTLVTVAVSSVLAVVTWYVAAPVILVVAPQYAESIPAIRLSGILAPIWALRVPGLALYAAGRTALYGVPACAGLLAFGAAVAVFEVLDPAAIVGAVAVGGLVRAAVMAVVLAVAVRSEGVHARAV